MTCYFPKTRAERQVDMLTFFPHHIPFPKVSTDGFIKRAALYIFYILTNPVSSTTVTLQVGDPSNNALLKTLEALSRVDPHLTPIIVPQKYNQLPMVLPNKASPHK